MTREHRKLNIAIHDVLKKSSVVVFDAIKLLDSRFFWARNRRQSERRLR